MRAPITTNGFNAVAAGQTATLDLPVGPILYHELRLTYGTSTAGGATQANTEAEVTEVRLKVNGKVQRTFTAEQLFDINALHGLPFNTGTLPIFLSEPWRRSAQGEDALGWGMADVQTFQVEVDIDSAASSPTLAARVVTEPSNRPMGPIVKWRKFVQPVSATGIVTNTNLPKSDDYYSLYCWSSVLDDVEVKVDQREVFKLTLAQLQFLLEDHGFTWVSGLVPIKFDFTKRVSDVLRTRRPDGSPIGELRVDFNMSAATAFTLIAESVGLRD